MEQEPEAEHAKPQLRPQAVRPMIQLAAQLVFLTLLAMFYMRERSGDLYDLSGRPRGGDFQQFYAAGLVYWNGDHDRLYDQKYFWELQRTSDIGINPDPPFFSLYPPQVGLLLAPLGGLPYPRAVEVWWLVQIACMVGGGWLLLRWASGISQDWRSTAGWLLAAFYPNYVLIANGHFVAILFLPLAAGLLLDRQGKFFWAGLCLSCLAMKPQLAVGIGLLALVGRPWSFLGGLIAGGLLQLLPVLLVMGPETFGNAIAKLLTLYSQHSTMYTYSPFLEQSIKGIGNNLSEAVGVDLAPWPKLLHLAAMLYVAYELVRWSWRFGRKSADIAAGPGIRERTAGFAVLATLILTPHLLVYDLPLLLVPVLMYWSAPALADESKRIIDRLHGSLLYFLATICAVYATLGFSLVPFAVLAVIASTRWPGIAVPTSLENQP